MDIRYKVVTVLHPNCNTPCTFKVPENLSLTIGDYVLCKTKKSDIPQVAQCITPSFIILESQLKTFYGITTGNLKPVVGVLKPVMCMIGGDEKNDSSDGQQDEWLPF